MGFFKLWCHKKLHHISLNEFYFKWMGRKSMRFSIKPYYHTQTLDIVVWIMKKEYLGESNLTQKITYLQEYMCYFKPCYKIDLHIIFAIL